MFNQLRLFLVITICISSQIAMADLLDIKLGADYGSHSKGDKLPPKIKIGKEDKLVLDVSEGEKIFRYTIPGPINSDTKGIEEIFGPSGGKERSSSKFDMKEIWQLPVYEKQVFCYAPDNATSEPLKFERSKTAGEIEVDIYEGDSLDPFHKLKWKSGEDILSVSTVLKWNEATYLVEFDKKYSIEIYVDTSALKSVFDKRAWMKENGCQQAQIDILLQKTEVLNSNTN